MDGAFVRFLSVGHPPGVRPLLYLGRQCAQHADPFHDCSRLDHASGHVVAQVLALQRAGKVRARGKINLARAGFGAPERGKGSRACFGAPQPALVIRRRSLHTQSAAHSSRPLSLASPPLRHHVDAPPRRFGFFRSPRAPLRRLHRRDLVWRETPHPWHLRHSRAGGPRVRRGGVAPSAASSGDEFSRHVEPAGAGSRASPAAFHRRGSSRPAEAAASPRHRRDGHGSLGGVAQTLPARHHRRTPVLQAKEDGASRLSGGQACSEAYRSIETEAARKTLGWDFEDEQAADAYIQTSEKDITESESETDDS